MRVHSSENEGTTETLVIAVLVSTIGAAVSMIFRFNESPVLPR
jgi:hypothetical protein